MKWYDRATIRPATAKDARFMGALEHETPSAAHWTKQQYAELFAPAEGSPERLALVASATHTDASEPRSGDVFLGFLVARHVAPEWELENIVVAPGALRKGMGRRLVESLLARARETNSEAVFLEVRESNAAARSLYEKVGFELTGRRKAYYKNPPEDAVLYRLLLP
jgi:ribosomal-protein-alanine N-acetyltransferase